MRRRGGSAAVATGDEADGIGSDSDGFSMADGARAVGYLGGESPDRQGPRKEMAVDRWATPAPGAHKAMIERGGSWSGPASLCGLGRVDKFGPRREMISFSHCIFHTSHKWN
jgi:hypothetical protein